MEKFEVKIYYSGYCTYKIDAENEEQAIKKARDFEVNKDEVLSNLENWQEADEALKIEKLDCETAH
ncbi:MAG: hypothetical protein L3J41_00025 [Melioribacteraceae bacterium]|nr:hypothetical protein [Melioribacteraceae bacterium]